VNRLDPDPSGVLMSKQCTGRRYLEIIQRAKAEPIRITDLNSKKEVRDMAGRIFSEFYEFQGYRTFANYIVNAENNKTENDYKQWLHDTFDNRLIIVDEAQDFSELNIMFIHLLNPPRLIVIGDPLQSIYGFRGAKVGAMENLMTGREYQTLNLTKSFRVPHVLSARQTAHAPGFHSHESCPDGTLTKWEKWKLSDIRDGDTILCRINAPLFSICFALIASGRGASIVGKDVSKSLGALLKRVCGKYPSIEKLQAYAKKEREEKPQRAGVTQDKVDCLIAFLSGFDGTTAEAQEKIKQMFK
jgi:hypothetical protein